MAEAFAAYIPPYLGRPTIPPVSWAQNGDQVVVILADGRKVSASVEEINQIMYEQKVDFPKDKTEFDEVEVDLKTPVTAPARKRKAKK